MCKNCRTGEGHCVCDRDYCASGFCAPVRCETCGHEVLQSVESSSGHGKAARM